MLTLRKCQALIFSARNAKCYSCYACYRISARREKDNNRTRKNAKITLNTLYITLFIYNNDVYLYNVMYCSIVLLDNPPCGHLP